MRLACIATVFFVSCLAGAQAKGHVVWQVETGG
jgi:hypothetical protein